MKIFKYIFTNILSKLNCHGYNILLVSPFNIYCICIAPSGVERRGDTALSVHQVQWASNQRINYNLSF